MSLDRCRREPPLWGLAALLLAGAAWTLTACGVGGEGTGGTQQQAAGRVEALGSVTVAGQRFDDSSAELLESLDPRSPEARAVGELRLGQQVQVSAEDGRASRLVLAPLVAGPLEAVDAAAGRMLVAGQTVLLDTAAAEPTVLEGLSTLGELDLGALLVVHGQHDGQGRIVATHVQLRESLSGLRVDGSVETVDRGAGTMRVGSLVIDWRDAARLPAGREPQPGDRVVAFGPLSSATGRLQAQVLQWPRWVLPAEGRAWVRGLLQAWQPAVARATVAGLPVDLSAVPAAQRQALAVGDLLHLSARTSGGLLRAEGLQRLDARLPLTGEITGRVGGLVDGRHFLLRGMAVDAAAARFRSLGERNLAGGVALRVGGRVSSSGLTADTVELAEPSPGETTVLAGPVRSWDATSGTLRLDGLAAVLRVGAGVAVEGGTLVDLVPGRPVQVRGMLSTAAFEVSWLSLADPQAEVELAGLAGNVEPDGSGGGAFEIGPVDMRWTSATRFTGPGNSAADLVDGRLVRVRGLRQGAEVVVSEVDARTTLPGVVRLRGTVTGYAGPTDFRVDGQRVDASGAVFEPATLRNSLAGALVDIEGTLAGGVLRASRVSDP